MKKILETIQFFQSPSIKTKIEDIAFGLVPFPFEMSIEEFSTKDLEERVSLVEKFLQPNETQNQNDPDFMLEKFIQMKCTTHNLGIVFSNFVKEIIQFKIFMKEMSWSDCEINPNDSSIISIKGIDWGPKTISFKNKKKKCF
tara:strand:- start:48 stop:473 length:426 start_codon:yes stop_codon:yes gene_type:complete